MKETIYASNVKVNYTEELKSVIIRGRNLDISAVIYKPLEEWFLAISGWRGLIAEIKDFECDDNDTAYTFEFQGSEEDKAVFEKNLKELGFINGLGRNINLEGEIDYVDIKPYIKPEEYGNPKNQYVLGKYFLEHKSFVNIDIGITWLKMAAEQGYAPAQLELGKFYIFNYNNDKYYQSLEEDKVDFERYLRETEIIKGLEDNIEGEIDYTDIIPYIESEKYGDAKIQYILGKHFSQYDSSVNVGIAWLKIAAEQGYAPAQAELEKNNICSCKVNDTDEKLSDYGYDLIKKAAEQNYVPAQFEMGKLLEPWVNPYDNFKINFFNREQIIKDEKRGHEHSDLSYSSSLEWLKKAADRGYISAQEKYIDLLKDMSGKKASLTLIICYSSGYYVNKDNQDSLKALKYQKAAIRKGVELDILDDWDDKMTLSYIDFLINASEAGDADVQYALGDLFYAYAAKLEKDGYLGDSRWVLHTAIDWLREAADQGNAKAQYKLGIYYAGKPDFGYSDCNEHKLAEKYFKIAYMQGIKDAAPDKTKYLFNKKSLFTDGLYIGDKGIKENHNYNYNLALLIEYKLKIKR